MSKRGKTLCIFVTGPCLPEIMVCGSDEDIRPNENNPNPGTSIAAPAAACLACASIGMPKIKAAGNAENAMKSVDLFGIRKVRTSLAPAMFIRTGKKVVKKTQSQISDLQLATDSENAKKRLAHLAARQPIKYCF